MTKNKAAPAKVKAVKAAMSGHGKGATKPTSAIKSPAPKSAPVKASATKVSAATALKKANAPASTMKKPTTKGNTIPTASAPKAPTASKAASVPKAAMATLAKPAPSKVEMPHSVSKKAAAVNASAIKSVAPAKPAVKAAPAVAKAAPAVAKAASAVAKAALAVAKAPATAVKPAVVASKPAAAVKPIAMQKPAVVVPSAPVTAPEPMHAKQHVLSGARPTAQTSFGRPMQPKAPILAPVAAALNATKPAAAVAASSEPKKTVASRHGFKTNEWIVYPAQGVGRIVAIEEQEIAGMTLELFVITFEKDKMTLRVPTGKAQTVGMRKLAEDGVVKRAMETLKGRARIKRTMWSRRAQEFEAKINSGDLVSVAEVVRDLFRAENQPEQSYSERQLYERALDRMAREIAAVDKLDERGAAQKIVEVLSKSAKGRRAAADEAAANTRAAGDEAVEAA